MKKHTKYQILQYLKFRNINYFFVLYFLAKSNVETFVIYGIFNKQMIKITSGS